MAVASVGIALVTNFLGFGVVLPDPLDTRVKRGQHTPTAVPLCIEGGAGAIMRGSHRMMMFIG